jgi:hypothetical protein
MSTRLLAWIAIAACSVLLLCSGLLGALFGGGASVSTGCYLPVDPSTSASSPVVDLSPPAGGFQAIGAWSADQVGNAATIVTVGIRMGIPPKGWVIAVAVAMQESNLTNLPGGNRDSAGLFQQRPSQGWGTVAQVMDPVYAVTKFYQALLRVDGWQAMAVTDAGQAVQKSAYPDAYAKWEDDATTLIGGVVSIGNRAMSVDLEQCLSNCPAILSTGSSDDDQSGCLGGQAVLARADTWLTAWDGGPVPYSSSSDPATWLDGYRRDCSGYASMALGLDGPGLDTAGLAAASTPIDKVELRAGDLLINQSAGGAGHVVIFDHWTDGAMTSYVGYEQSGDGGTHHRTIPYPYFGDYLMTPYQF